MRSSCILTFILLSLVFTTSFAQSFHTTLMTDLLGPTHINRSTKTLIHHPSEASILWTVKDQDTGFLETGSSFSTRYKFENTGSHPLVIQSVNCSCNGSIASVPDQIVDPGKTGEINIKLTPSIDGAFSCHFSVLSNTAGIVDVLTIRGVAIK